MESSHQPEFSTLLLSIAQAIYAGLGLDSQMSASSSPELNLPMAQYNIALLELLKSKTAGNLTEAEAKLIEQILFDVRMKYIGATQNEKK